MIYNDIFSANNRLPNTVCRQQAKKVDIGTLLFNHLNPGFAAMMSIMREINKLTH
jgi:hypothetical protein